MTKSTHGSDRELLEMAAKAIGYRAKFNLAGACQLWTDDLNSGYIRFWYPLTDDGDEARLEAALKLDVVWCFYTVKVGESTEYYDQHNGDKQAARRRAGTRAAAAIGAASHD